MNQEMDRSVEERLNELEHLLARLRFLLRLGCYREALECSQRLGLLPGLVMAVACELLEAEADGKEVRP